MSRKMCNDLSKGPLVIFRQFFEKFRDAEKQGLTRATNESVHPIRRNWTGIKNRKVCLFLVYQSNYAAATASPIELIEYQWVPTVDLNSALALRSWWVEENFPKKLDPNESKGAQKRTSLTK